jgi:hypothetical protein
MGSVNFATGPNPSQWSNPWHGIKTKAALAMETQDADLAWSVIDDLRDVEVTHART